jgi:YtcA family
VLLNRVEDDCVGPRISVKIAPSMTQCKRIRPRIVFLRSLAITGLVAWLATAAGGCDPVINIGGANFPGWLLCAIVGIALAGLLHLVFAALRIEPYMGPGVVIYPSLALLLGCVTWLVFFNRI